MNPRTRAAILAAITAVVFAVLVFPSSALAVPTLLGGADELAFQVEPAQIGVSGDGTGYFGGEGYVQEGHRFPSDLGSINWTRWGSSSATGEGLFWLNNCKPYCAAGSFYAHPLKIRASVVRRNHFQHMVAVFRYGGRTRHFHYELAVRGSLKIWQPLYDKGFRRGASSASASQQRHSLRTTIGIWPSFTQFDGYPHYYQRPHHFRVTSEESEIKFKRLKWRNWGGSKATARGRAKTCIYETTCQTGPVRLVARSLTACGAGRIYLLLDAYKVPMYGPKVEVPIGAAGC